MGVFGWFLGKSKDELLAIFEEYVAKSDKTKKDFLELAEVCKRLAEIDE